MQGSHIGAAAAAIAERIRAALLAGHDTRELREELSRLELAHRREIAEREAAEREARAAAETAEQERQAAATAALVAAIEGRVRARVAGLEAPAAPNIRRTPQGIHIAEGIEE